MMQRASRPYVKLLRRQLANLISVKICVFDLSEMGGLFLPVFEY